MPLTASVLGSMPRNQLVLNIFSDYDNVYSNDQYREIFDNYAKTLIQMQESTGIDVVNDGEIQRSGYFSIFYDCFNGYLPTNIGLPMFLDDGRYYHYHHNKAYKCWEHPFIWSNYPAQQKYGSIVIDKIIPKYHGSWGSIFEIEATTIKKYASKKTKITMPSPYQIMRRSYHPEFSRSAYKSKEEYLSDIVYYYKIITKQIEEIGIDIIQFDDDVITLLLQEQLRHILNIEEEVFYYTSSCNEVFSNLSSAESAVHICRANKSLSWGNGRLISLILKSLNANQINLAFGDDPNDLLPLNDFPSGSSLLFGIIDSTDFNNLDEPGAMLHRLSNAAQYVTMNRIILTSSCGFSPFPAVRKGYELVLIKLSNLVAFRDAVNEHGLCEKAIESITPYHDFLNDKFNNFQ